MKRNVFEDFKVLVTLKNEDLIGCPFSFTYSVKDDAEGSTYVANWAGLNSESNSHVVPVYDSAGNQVKKQFFIVFENHGLPVGKVVCQRRFTIEDADFSDGKQNRVYNELTDIELAEGIFEEVGDITAVVGVNLIKPIRGVDYYTEADEAAITAAIKDSILSEVNTLLASYAKTTDLDAYAKTTDLDAYAKTTDLDAYAKTTDLDAYAKTNDLEAYAKTADVPSIAGLATESSVTELAARVSALESAE